MFTPILYYSNQERSVISSIEVGLAYDGNARVWYVAQCEALPGLIAEAKTIEALVAKLPRLAKALIEADSAELEPQDIPIEVVARMQASTHVGPTA
jgi:predicted RNase H-like HicB family nuclease